MLARSNESKNYNLGKLRRIDNSHRFLAGRKLRRGSITHQLGYCVTRLAQFSAAPKTCRQLSRGKIHQHIIIMDGYDNNVFVNSDEPVVLLFGVTKSNKSIYLTFCSETNGSAACFSPAVAR